MIRWCCSWDPLSVAQLVYNVSGVRVGEDLSRLRNSCSASRQNSASRSLGLPACSQSWYARASISFWLGSGIAVLRVVLRLSWIILAADPSSSSESDRFSKTCPHCLTAPWGRDGNGGTARRRAALRMWRLVAAAALKNETAHQSFSALLLHSGISENDNRRSALARYVTNLRDTGEYDFDLLQTAAVAYLKGLDELHDDRRARLAADQALAEQLESRRAQPGT